MKRPGRRRRVRRAPERVWKPVRTQPRLVRRRAIPSSSFFFLLGEEIGEQGAFVFYGIAGAAVALDLFLDVIEAVPQQPARRIHARVDAQFAHALEAEHGFIEAAVARIDFDEHVGAFVQPAAIDEHHVEQRGQRGLGADFGIEGELGDLADFCPARAKAVDLVLEDFVGQQADRGIDAKRDRSDHFAVVRSRKGNPVRIIVKTMRARITAPRIHFVDEKIRRTASPIRVRSADTKCFFVNSHVCDRITVELGSLLRSGIVPCALRFRGRFCQFLVSC
ncbi:hypothetical protein AB595_27195 [Massilia sp. WF1]|nr:hypothetical protein AB595_27195 [Massilia sp. WF1]